VILVPPRSGGGKFRASREAFRRLLPALVLAVGAIGAPTLVMGAGGLGRLRALEAEREKVGREMERTRARIEELRATAQATKRDPAALERIARDQLGLLRSTELVVFIDADRR
jgi:cell division protein FtsB